MITPLLLPFSLTFQRGDPIPILGLVYQVRGLMRMPMRLRTRLLVLVRVRMPVLLRMRMLVLTLVRVLMLVRVRVS